MPEIEQVIEQPHSCKISINAKGQWSGEIKVYAETIDQARTRAIEHAGELAKLISDKNDTTQSGGK